MASKSGATPKQGDHAGLDGFVWFFGVVEDRDDPLNAGRVRVRPHAFNTDDKTLLPTDKLPWSQVVMSPTSASLGGIGTSATGLTEGSFVMGFYTDGKSRQQPMILGSVPGIAAKGPGSGATGHSDPDGIYPPSSKVGKADTPGLAIPAEFPSDPITINKDVGRTRDIPIASRFKTPTVNEDKDDGKYPTIKDGKVIPDTWSEPVQRGGMPSAYPFNHVTKTEGGHVFEVDDTKGGERIHQYHKSGTFYEIQPNGNRVTKIVGSDYEIVVKDKNVYIQGACNVTIKGDAKMFFEGDLVQEVKGNHHLTVHGDSITKIRGNQVLEVSSARSTNIEGDDTTTVGGSGTSNIKINSMNNVGVARRTAIGGTDTKNVSGVDTTIAGGGINFMTPKSTNIASVGDLNFASAGNLAIKSKGTFKLKIEGNAYQTYAAESHFRHEGHFKFYYGADTSKDFAAAVDHVPPTPTRTTDTTRNTAEPA